MKRSRLILPPALRGAVARTGSSTAVEKLSMKRANPVEILLMKFFR
jgi:hypothetical protein